MKKIRVLVVDDSALVREILTHGLVQDPGIEVVGSAPDVFVARDKIVELEPDVITLDIEMPKMDGVEFLRRLMPQYPLPVVIVSSLSQRGKKITVEALEAGAVDFVSKPTSNIADGLTRMMQELQTKIKIASTANVSHWKFKRHPPTELRTTGSLAESTDKVIAIGASTGGTEAIIKVVEQFPRNAPGVVIVQHMPPGFTTMYADRLNQLCKMEVKEAINGDRVMQGQILLAPGDYHLKVVRSGGIYKVRCTQEEKLNGHRPSVDALFNSVAEQVGNNAIGIILTGMGNDGAQGLRSMRLAGSFNIAQDEATSVVFGMPKTAVELGAAHRIVPVDQIAFCVLDFLTRTP
ncbi:MAG: chemotaxis response regulator protein-glutamate methylesterase [Candidatus Delongbacteria bacterium]|nr:chemotaxis response regulator protein-glutamate methylesterase [Candidatus Delongbacteria bacterium]